MEFLDSLDLDTIHKKSHRVRSWYLYEQFKSLEKSQLDAAQKLKDRSYQERILRQELSERRARRKLYDQFGLCQSEPGLKRGKCDSYKSSVSTSDDDFFENFFVLHEDERVTHVTGENEFTGENDFTDDTFSQDGLSASKCCVQNYSVDDHKDDNCSYTGSIASVVENLNPHHDEFLPPNEMEFKQSSIDEDINMQNSLAEEINKQLDSVKENIQCLEEMANFDEIDKISVESMSLNNARVRELKHITECKKPDPECNMIAIWSRLVSFAYQVVQLNHGNCYCDYSSQFLTAVLACDVLRRGVNRMCHILQPYVSPIEFARDETDVSNASRNLNAKRKKLVQLRKRRKICEIKPLSCQKPKKFIKTGRSERKHSCRNCSEHYSQSLYKQWLTNGSVTAVRRRRAGHPWRTSTKVYHHREEISSKSTTSSSAWSELWREKPKVSRRCYSNHNRALYPMLKIAQCIDSILKDIDDSKRDNM